MRKDPTEDALAELRAMRERGEVTDLPRFIKNKSSAVIARAAEMAQDATLMPELIEAFRRVFPNAAKRDPGCRALTNIAQALVRLDCSAAEVYSLGIQYQQWEASFGPRVDTAAALRAACAMGLVGMGDPDALLECCELLNDHALDARIGAVRALGVSGRHEAELLLRFKAKLGDEKNEVTSETFTSLLTLGPKSRSVPYVGMFLSGDDEEIAEAAAMALGESRTPEAVELLQLAVASSQSRSRTGAILWGLALSRDQGALEFCFDRLKAGDIQALDALSLYKSNQEWRARVRKLLDTKQNVEWDRTWSAKWSD